MCLSVVLNHLIPLTPCSLFFSSLFYSFLFFSFLFHLHKLQNPLNHLCSAMLTHKYAKQKLVSFLLNCVFISVKVVIGHLHMQQIMSTPLGPMIPCMLALIHAIFLISATLLWYLCSTFFWVHCQPSISWDITYQIFVRLLYFYPQLNPILKI